MRYEDLTGKVFGRYTVIEKAPSKRKPSGNKVTMWRCRCSCGTIKDVKAEALKDGRVLSCGCYAKDVNRKRLTTHGDSDSRLYHIWDGMIARCHKPNNKYYKRYGGRGINVCNEWRSDYQAFKDWSVKNGYGDDLTIDRIDNNDDYKPENCRWTSMKVQSNNRSSNRVYTINGETHNVTQWSSIYNVPSKRVFQRLDSGWSIEDALTVPPMS